MIKALSSLDSIQKGGAPDMTEQKTILIQQLITLLTQLLALNEAEVAPTADPIKQQPIEMLTIPEVMALGTGLSEHTLRKLIAQGKVYAIRTGEGKRGKILISKASLVEYLNGKAS